jgi:predicted TIM-barrel fold metal-dependent hydrolase
MKIIDSHCHIHMPEWVNKCNSNDFLIEEFNYRSSEKEILANMDEAGIDQTIIFPMPSINVNLEAANLYVLYMSKLYPKKFIPFAIINNNPEKWFKLGVKGFKEHSFGQKIQKNQYGKDIISDKFKYSYRFMEDNGLPLLLHAGVNKIERIKEFFFKETPELKIILAHLGADFIKTGNHLPNKYQVLETLNELKDYPNIYFDIAAIGDIEILQDAIDLVDDNKLIFGSDFPYEKPSDTLNRLDKLRLSKKQKTKLFYDNITDIIGVHS